VANRLTAWAKKVARSFAGIGAEEYISRHTAARTSGVSVTPETALKNSAVWAACRIRADLISTFPVGVYRKVDGDRLSVPRPQILTEPGGPQWDYQDWMYATQFDLDRAGNTLGLITARDGRNLPAEIMPVGLSEWSVRQKQDGSIKYQIRNEEYSPDEVWHERQYVVAGLPVGLSPVAYAASVISENISTQQFAQSWFGRGAVPAAHFRNTQQTINDPAKAAEVKSRFMNSVSIGEPLVTGSDWEYKPLQAEQMGMEWLEDRKFSLTDIARFFGVPADLIDAAISGQSITYANITERNLQFLIMHLGPAIARREKNLSKLTAAPRFVKLNTDALLRMDPKARAESIKTRIDSRTLTNTEARALEDLPPLTPEQVAEFQTIYGAPRVQPPAVQPSPAG
jgi:HK97 family phage portal protein